MARRPRVFVPVDRLVSRAVDLLYQSPGGMTRVDLLAAFNLDNTAWHALRAGLEQQSIIAAGNGKNKRHFHPVHESAAAILGPSRATRPRPQAVQSAEPTTAHQGDQREPDER